MTTPLWTGSEDAGLTRPLVPAPETAAYIAKGADAPSGDGPTRSDGDSHRVLFRHRLRLLCVLGFCGWSLFGGIIYGGWDPVFRVGGVGPECLIVLGVTTLAPLVALLLLTEPAAPFWRLRSIELTLLVLCCLTLGLLRATSLAHNLSAGTDSESTASLGALYASAQTNLLLLCCIVAFGVLIPNNWRRTLASVVALAAATLTAEAAARLAHASVVTVTDISALFTTCLTLLIGTGVTVFGAYRIARLQGEVREARRLVQAFGQYALVRRLGAGGMGEVYLARHQLLKRPCAVKLIRSEFTTNDTFLRRFRREAMVATRLTHPAALQVYDYGQTADGTLYYAMEYVEGLTLDQLVQRFGPLPAGRVVGVLRQLCGALAEAHALSLIHRDIKPANVMLCVIGGRADAVKLLDFGLVFDSNDVDARLTQPGGVIGSPAYMSPEQALGETELGFATDLYSLGALGYFLLTGRPPFIATNALQLLQCHIAAPVERLSRHVPSVPPGIEAVVMRLLQKRPADRYGSARQVEQALAVCDFEDWTDDDASQWWEWFGQVTPPAE